MEWNSEHFYLPWNGSERNSESFLFRGTAGIPSELTICSGYSVFRGIIFLSEIANPNPNIKKQTGTKRQKRRKIGKAKKLSYWS
jgi:hypothetical protein